MGARGEPVEALVDRAYRAFARPAPAGLGVCTACCMDPAAERAMLAKAPRDLTPDEVRDWLSAAFSGERAAVEWMLPRILDLLLDGVDVAVAGNEVALRRLSETGFPGEWPLPQVEVVREACFALLGTRGANSLDETLCLIANSGLDIAPFLARLDALPDETLAELLYADWTGASGLRIWRTAFWQGVPGRQAVWDWFTSSDLEARMWRAGSAGNMRAIAVAECIAASPAKEPPV